MISQSKKTMTACFIGYITQSIVTSFIPLLYYEFQRNHDVPFYKITITIAVNFIIQLLVDLFASKYATRIGYRKCLVAAHILCAAGFILLTFLPDIMNFFEGFLISVIIYATGAGLLEVLVSPVVEACPTKNKTGIMSFLHSFYCWGVVATVLISTLFFWTFGISNWKIMTLIWALVPITNAIIFSRVKIYSIDTEENIKPNYKTLFSQKAFWLMFLLMISAGACEQALSQWGSTIAEASLNLTKLKGDMFAVCGFAIMMGISRLIYAKLSKKIPLRSAILFCSALCALSMLLIGLSNSSIISIIGFILCGFSVGIFWPGTFSFATKNVKHGGTTMFALLALGGDIGCTCGPSLVGSISYVFNGNFQTGILYTVVFPIAMILALIFIRNNTSRKKLHN